MCLLALALDDSRRFPLVLAANRDEFFARPASRLAWWSPGGQAPDILSGRDLSAGGTWLGLTAAGRLAMLTNVRRPFPAEPDAPSRGLIVPQWLRGDLPADRFWPRVALSGHAPFNLIAIDFRQGDSFFASSEQACPQRLERGLFGLSNASLDTPWPKVTALKQRLRSALSTAMSVDELANLLFAALADREPADDAALPHTGVPHDKEKMLSPAFIRSPDGQYGTRCSTLVITERVNKRLVTHVLERTFTAAPGLALLRRASLKDWPPRYLLDDPQAAHGPADPPSEISPVADAELADAPSPSAAVPVKKRRVRSLLKPVAPR